MKKRIAALVLSALTLLSCVSCGEKPEVQEEIPVPAPVQPAPEPEQPEPPEAQPERPEEPEPQMPAPAFGEAFALVQERSLEAQSMLAGGFEAVDREETVLVYGDLCRRVELYRNADGHESRSHFAVSALGALYYSPDTQPEQWHPINGQAMVFAGAEEEDLFFVATDDWATEYEDYIDAAQSVSTPVVGLEMPKPIVVVALKDHMRLTVELDFEPAPDVFFDGVMTRGQAIAVSAELSPEHSDLRLVGVWQEGGEEYTAVWYANWQDGVPDYTAYIPAT